MSYYLIKEMCKDIILQLLVPKSQTKLNRKKNTESEKVWDGKANKVVETS
jgi:hypothetical protein